METIVLRKKVLWSLLEKWDNFIQVTVKSFWGAPKTLHSLQTPLLGSPTPSDALAGGGRLLLTLVGYMVGSGSSSSGTQITNSSFLAWRRPCSKPMVDLSGLSSRWFLLCSSTLCSALSPGRLLTTSLASTSQTSLVFGAAKQGGCTQFPRKAGLLAFCLRWDGAA